MIDSSFTVKDPNNTPLPECNECEYKNFSGCKSCGSEILDRCELRKEYARACQEFEQIRMLIDKYKESGLFKDKCHCNCNKNDKQPIYCIKNYNLE